MEIVLSLALGLTFGSFLNALVYRLANQLPLWQRSMCPHCRQKLLNRDLIPLISFILLKGRCRFCRAFIGWDYFIVEFVTAFLFLLAYLNYGFISLMLVSAWFYILVFLFIFIFDLKYYTILDVIIWPVLIISFILNVILGYYWLDLVLAALVGGGFFYLQHLASKGKWIGWGDVKLGLLLGVILGLEYLILTLLISYFVGGLIAIYLLISKKKKFGDILPMGSFLAGAGMIVLLWGDLILRLLLNV
jgi:leader peptidase (prepilin peptidase) / N-methyltransferase